MLFNSLIFIAVFLPIALIGWYSLQKAKNPIYAKIFLVGMSLWFYGYFNVRYLAILIVSVLANYGCSKLFQYCSAQTKRRAVLALGLFVNIGLLFYFKYFNFFIDNCNFLFHTDLHFEKIALPLGISFFTFQQISFIVDRYKDEAPAYGFWDYACFVTYFPQLVAGPIVLHSEFVPQLLERKNRRLNFDKFFDGISLFILGMGKKVLLADVLALIVSDEYNKIYYLDSLSAGVAIVCYMLELYFDFSGYSDMARGLGKMFGFELPHNFNSPLMAVSVKDFWRRWHMTLSRFLTTYIYIPLGGNRKGQVRKCVNLMLVFLVSGFWHGANWTYVVWGLLHGIAMVWESVFPNLRFKQAWINRICTGIYVTFTFSIFRSESLAQEWLLIKKLFTGGITKFIFELSSALKIPETYAVQRMLEMKFPSLQDPFYFVCLVILLFISIYFVRGKKAEGWIENKGRTKTGIFMLALIFVWSFISLSQVSTFLYFDF